MIALKELDENLRDLPHDNCRLIADRVAAEEGRPFMVYQAADIDNEARRVPLGSGYLFGSYKAEL